MFTIARLTNLCTFSDPASVTWKFQVEASFSHISTVCCYRELWGNSFWNQTGEFVCLGHTDWTHVLKTNELTLSEVTARLGSALMHALIFRNEHAETHAARADSGKCPPQSRPAWWCTSGCTAPYLLEILSPATPKRGRNLAALQAGGIIFCVANGT